MGLYEEHVLPRVIDVALGGAKLGELRARAMDGLSGTVLEIGFGSGRNVPHYPAEVDLVHAVDPAIVGRKLARRRLAASPVRVEFVDLDDDRIPLPEASADHALSTWTLCTVADELGTLQQIRRILRPGGQLHFLEHGLSDDPKVARRQRRFDGLQQRIAGGCHLDRVHTDVLAAAGFVDVDSTTFTIPGPKSLSFLYMGTARVPLAPAAAR